MALRKILTVGNPTLNKTSRKVENFDERLAILIDDMVETMHSADGVGLAAVQVGSLRRVVVIDIGEGVMELVNPEIVEESGVQEENEGCLSLPGECYVTRRPMNVTVKAQDRHGKWYVLSGSGLKAKAFCHEIDHLDGILFTSHAIAKEK